MLRNAFAVLLLLSASGFDSSPGGSQPDPNTQNFDPNANPQQQPANDTGFPTSTSTGKGEKSYQEAIGGEPLHPTLTDGDPNTNPPALD